MADFKYILMFFLGPVVAGCESPQVVEERLVAAFGETMFGSRGQWHEGVSAGKEDFHIAKWQSSVEVSVMEGATPANVALVRNTMPQFAELTGLSISVVGWNNASARLQIYFSSKKDFVINDNEPAKCFARSRSDRQGRLDLAEVHIARIDDRTWQTDCLVHELLHAFGWRGHTHRVRSAISYMHGETELTRWDAYLMRTLYDPRIEFGASRDDALPVARDVLHELLNAR